jgi:transcriptional regulator
MHPNPAFAADSDDVLDRAAAIGFAHVFAATPVGPMAVHSPVTRHGPCLRFHIARANRAAERLGGAGVLISVAGPQGYVSPAWYADPPNQVPTWNYVAIEIDGIARAIDEAALVEQLDALAAGHEPYAAPTTPWSRAKMDDGLFRRMLRGIVGFEVEVTAVRTTTKLSQNKSAADRAGVVAGLRASGNAVLADMMERAAERQA